MSKSFCVAKCKIGKCPARVCAFAGFYFVSRRDLSFLAMALINATNAPPLVTVPPTRRWETPAAGFDFAGRRFLESITRVLMTPPQSMAATTSPTYRARTPSLHARPFHVFGFLD